jgi:hypothetical protein
MPNRVFLSYFSKNEKKSLFKLFFLQEKAIVLKSIEIKTIAFIF